jgi:hypothetical protein
MRSSLRRWLNGRNKTSFLSQYIGCDLNTLKKWLQLTAFINGYYDFNIYDMTKDYHIDHKIPVTKFDLTKPEEIAKAYHYSNLQILSAVDNKRKYKKSDYENFDKVKNSLTVRIFKMFN